MLLGSYSGYSQEPVIETYKLSGHVLKVEKQELLKLTNGCENIMNHLSLKNQKREVFSESICTAEIEDLSITKKGYLTVVEHHSSPVGWSKYYVFDLCKQRLVITKELDEGTKLAWDHFITLDDSTKGKYVDKVIPF